MAQTVRFTKAEETQLKAIKKYTSMKTNNKAIQLAVREYMGDQKRILQLEKLVEKKHNENLQLKNSIDNFLTSFSKLNVATKEFG